MVHNGVSSWGSSHRSFVALSLFKMKTDHDYTHFTDKELEEKIKELILYVMQSYSIMVKTKAKRENRTKLRKEIARIRTELKIRKNPKTPL